MGRIFDARVVPLVVGLSLLGCQSAPPPGDDASGPADDGGTRADRTLPQGSDGSLVDPPRDATVDATPADAAPDAPILLGPCGNGVMDPGEMCDEGVRNDDISGQCSRLCRPLIEWTARHDGPAHLDDEALALAWDPRGALLVTGSESVTVDDGDVWVAKLDVVGQLLWSRTHAGPAGRTDSGQGVAVDADSNVVVNATEWLDLRTTSISTRKYDALGNLLWLRSYAPGLDSAGGVTVDAVGNVIAVGTVSSGTGAQSAFIRKYSASGTTLWSREIQGTSVDYNGAQAVALGPAGSVLVAGILSQTAPQIDSWITRLSAAGVEVWTHWSEAALLASATAVAADGDETVTCGYYGPRANTIDGWVRRLDSHGQLLWSRTYARTGPDRCTGIAVDPDTGEVVVAFSEDLGLALGRAVVRKYTAGGTALWTRAYSGAAGLGARANAVAIGPGGMILVAGTEATTDRGNDAFVRAYAP